MSTEDAQATARKGGRRWLRALISVSLLGFLLSRIEIQKLMDVVVDAHFGLLLIAFLLFIPDRLFASYRWYLLLRHRNPTLGLLTVIRLVYVSSFLGTFLPGSVGVDLIRIYGLAKSTADLAFSASSVLVERLLALFALMVLLFVGLIFSPAVLPQVAVPVACLGLAGLAGLCVVSLNDRFRRLTLRLIPGALRPRLGPKFEKLYRCLDHYRDRPRLMITGMVLGLLFQVFRIWHVFVLGTALGMDVTYLSFLLMIPIIRLTEMLPISIAGIGVREAGYVFLLAQIGVPPETALATSLLMFISGLILNLPGAWFYARRSLGT